MNLEEYEGGGGDITYANNWNLSTNNSEYAKFYYTQVSGVINWTNDVKEIDFTDNKATIGSNQAQIMFFVVPNDGYKVSSVMNGASAMNPQDLSNSNTYKGFPDGTEGYYLNPSITNEVVITLEEGVVDPHQYDCAVTFVLPEGVSAAELFSEISFAGTTYTAADFNDPENPNTLWFNLKDNQNVQDWSAFSVSIKVNEEYVQRIEVEKAVCNSYYNLNVAGTAAEGYNVQLTYTNGGNVGGGTYPGVPVVPKTIDIDLAFAAAINFTVKVDGVLDGNAVPFHFRHQNAGGYEDLSLNPGENQLVIYSNYPNCFASEISDSYTWVSVTLNGVAVEDANGGYSFTLKNNDEIIITVEPTAEDESFTIVLPGTADDVMFKDFSVYSSVTGSSVTGLVNYGENVINFNEARVNAWLEANQTPDVERYAYTVNAILDIENPDDYQITVESTSWDEPLVVEGSTLSFSFNPTDGDEFVVVVSKKAAVYTFACEEDVLAFYSDLYGNNELEATYEDGVYTLVNSDEAAMIMFRAESDEWRIGSVEALNGGTLLENAGMYAFYTTNGDFEGSCSFTVELTAVIAATVTVSDEAAVNYVNYNGRVSFEDSEATIDLSFNSDLEIVANPGYKVAAVTFNGEEIEGLELPASEATVPASAFEGAESGAEIAIEFLALEPIVYTFVGEEGLTITRNGVTATYEDGVYTLNIDFTDWNRYDITVSSDPFVQFITGIYYGEASVGEENPRDGSYTIYVSQLFEESMEFTVVTDENVHAREIQIYASDPDQIGIAFFTNAPLSNLEFTAENPITVLISKYQYELYVSGLVGEDGSGVSGIFEFDGNEYTAVVKNPESTVQSYIFDLTPLVTGDYMDVDTIYILTDNFSGVSSIFNDENGNVEIYNLQGVKVNPENVTPGFYIVNGKKVLVK